jgi:alkanesulfonate monooxygenase
MQLGVGLPSFASPSHVLSPERFRRFARRADEDGFAGAWVSEHLVKPSHYATSFMDPLVALSVAAGAAPTLPLGTSVLLLPLRNPVLVAKRLATLQQLTTSRVTLGVGTGSVEAEFDAVGVPIEERSPRLLEGLELIRDLFAGGATTFDGEFFSVTDVRLEPAPTEPPRILAGGSGVETDDGRRMPGGVKRRLRYADGWIAPPLPVDALAADWQSFADVFEATDRDPERAHRVAHQFLQVEPGTDERRVRRAQRQAYESIVGPERPVSFAMDRWLSGTVEQVVEHLREYERLEFDEVILHPAIHHPDDLDRQLRLYGELLRPALH